MEAVDRFIGFLVAGVHVTFVDSQLVGALDLIGRFEWAISLTDLLALVTTRLDSLGKY